MLRIIITLTLWIFAMGDDWTTQCNKCKCIWSDGRKKADCSNIKLITIPDNLSSEIRDVDISSNELYELRDYAFASVNLQNINKLKLRNCTIEKVHKFALAKLALLIELDLSLNDISELEEDTFKDNEKLRTLFLNHNNLKQLHGTVFHNLRYLQKFEVNSNKITYVDPYIFKNGPALQYVDLSNNKLKYIDPQFLMNLERIMSFNVQMNPWICDCNLKKLRDLVIENNLVTTPTACVEPRRLNNTLWSQLESKDFACQPKIISIFSNVLDNVVASNVTVFCKAEGDPDLEVNWMLNGRTIDRDSQKQKYYIREDTTGSLSWCNLTIFQFDFGDRGEYRCIAKNAAGKDEKNISLTIGNDFYNKSVYRTSSSGMLNLAIGLSVAIVVLLILVAVLIFYCIKTSRKSESKLNPLNQSNDYINLPVRQEAEKSLITEVNPVTKPPRQYSASAMNGSMELDIKTNLLENDMSYGIDDESHSFDFERPTHSKSQNINAVNGIQLPPDLLSFSHRSIQISPTASSVSMIQDPIIQPQGYGLPTNIQSPLYDSLNMCRTLPYSRSQSPFVSPLNSVMVTSCPSGYVTIPRKPRASWSSESPGHSLIADPVYDNLGARTTAGGNSQLSLNRLNDIPKPKVATLPRNYLIPRATSAEQQVIKRKPNTEYEPFSLLSTDVDSANSGIQNNSGAGAMVKVPPRPPPKPKKRSSTGPLFEDEGEDGTEV
ncbi:leucine-rich repeat-containing protein 24 [Agrilus planipennis]|uniref:Leucine-rich repeat-containing protein 24 n=1 Tax=Agrilus planipennis TaxID=224129 RepID=A0A1W4X516_AGRPL|nr:leucine-rich repeat-containing protein 24 [Agrilus planipennis]